MTVEENLHADLRLIPHVDDVRVVTDNSEFYVVVVDVIDHGLVDRRVLLSLEDEYSERMEREVIISVRAHQGRK